ncbi:hypothetical protein CLDAP_16900 [Caldilinea aerophila DSM 14535 = NBRC 104270]|uniref:Uncharacterized protein n=1 Tax=Caldilinea aerophila (strain DSM 14535 / JCM 11387 / NBRC 104270 / STL-6-O1) TaxID=926550 RepID=I0I392_CALAS|nr:hypothetical protein CLDAP_16900 [Caldilinea aerophila DSM 14535 = NBRC 104270]
MGKQKSSPSGELYLDSPSISPARAAHKVPDGPHPETFLHNLAHGEKLIRHFGDIMRTV